jgi:hypothetical protein
MHFSMSMTSIDAPTIPRSPGHGRRPSTDGSPLPSGPMARCRKAASIRLLPSQSSKESGSLPQTKPTASATPLSPPSPPRMCPWALPARQRIICRPSRKIRSTRRRRQRRAGCAPHRADLNSQPSLVKFRGMTLRARRRAGGGCISWNNVGARVAMVLIFVLGFLTYLTSR